MQIPVERRESTERPILGSDHGDVHQDQQSHQLGYSRAPPEPGTAIALQGFEQEQRHPQDLSQGHHDSGDPGISWQPSHERPQNFSPFTRSVGSYIVQGVTLQSPPSWARSKTAEPLRGSSIPSGASCPSGTTPQSISQGDHNGSHGTLMLSQGGRSKYLGPTAGSEWLKDVWLPFFEGFEMQANNPLVINTRCSGHPTSHSCPFSGGPQNPGSI